MLDDSYYNNLTRVGEHLLNYLIPFSNWFLIYCTYCLHQTISFLIQHDDLLYQVYPFLSSRLYYHSIIAINAIHRVIHLQCF